MSDLDNLSNITKTLSLIFNANELSYAMKIIAKTPFIRTEKLLEGQLFIASGTATYPEDGQNAETLIKSTAKKMCFEKLKGELMENL